MPDTTGLSSASAELATTPAFTGSRRDSPQVRLAGSAAIPKIDVRFLIGSTGAMVGLIAAVQAPVEEIRNRPVHRRTTVDADVHIGVGDSKDMEESEPERLRPRCGSHQGTATVPRDLRRDSTTMFHCFCRGDYPTHHENHSQHWRVERL